MTRGEADAILVDLAEVAEVRIRAMMGGWLVYVHGVLVGQLNDGEFFLKSSRFADAFALELERRSPYPGAKPAVFVPSERRADSEWLQALLAGTVAEFAAHNHGSARRRRTGSPW